jgi:hypothetical protein
MNERKIRIIGCARSGTLYTTKLLQAIGLQVGHEYTEKDGTVSAFALGEPPYPVFDNTNKEDPKPEGRCAHVGEDITKIDWYVTLHQVRNPLKCIASNTIVLVPKMYEYINRICPEFPLKKGNKLLRCMLYWYHWNLACEKEAEYTYQIEQIEEKWPIISEKLGIGFAAMPKSIPTTTNRGLRNRPWVDKEFDINSVQVLHDVDPFLTAEIISLSEKYGYQLS